MFRKSKPLEICASVLSNNNGALNVRGYDIIVICDQYLALSRKRYKIEPSSANKKTVAKLSMIRVSMVLSDL